MKPAKHRMRFSRILGCTLAFIAAFTSVAFADDAKTAIAAQYDRINLAFSKGDPSILRPILADEYVDHDVTGHTETRDESIADVSAPKPIKNLTPTTTIETFAQTGDRATVTATQHATFDLANGSQSGHSEVRERDRWVKRNGTWLLLETKELEESTYLGNQLVDHKTAPTP